MIDLSLFHTPEEAQQEVAKRCRQRRKELRYTQAELARRSGMSLSSYKRFEQTGEIAFSSLCRVAHVLDSLEDIEALFTKKKYTSIQEVIDARRRHRKS
ncbi:helix-turn-helix domain-containing protein [uncultured Faecalibaculum sp.]|uniref:helix-turn-helix domain-containing protein n=1 Tax=uncultured Faecalibaculum sp. TaxID=1729681 RepID=UPI0025DF269C|nr:helix-turn-helix transcriptional regulator [uncultured Faecalibaculum sp.]